jgi:uncharacterized protein (DUF362 family)
MSIYIDNGDNISGMAYSICEKAELKNALHVTDNILIKPNLTVEELPNTGTTTHVEVAQGVIEYLKKHGFKNIIIGEGSWRKADTMKVAKMGGWLDIPGIKFVDLKKDEMIKMVIRLGCNNYKIEIAETYLGADFVINLPLLKGHYMCGISSCIKNLKGVLSDSSKKNFHTWGVHNPLVAFYLFMSNKKMFNIVDNICSNVFDATEDLPITMNRMYGGFDAIELDMWGAAQLGIDYQTIHYLNDLSAFLKKDMESINEVEIRPGKGLLYEDRREYTEGLKAIKEYVDDRGACCRCGAQTIMAARKLIGKGICPSLSVGTGFKDIKSDESVGVGFCCNDFKYNIPGCPPSVDAIIKYVKENKDILPMVEKGFGL